ncbi:pirin family protein [Paenibacillus anaericanus]|uniref:Pirin family protein n=1 Tax=Paenibacillus anaericanus TaxID=170367 RepID=A0A3S1DFR9_9BACL|nr:pirin family protein [Paenibacillus anaericanus]RUT43903.1 pirin family protein [Paenibacillus anaericanus]
MIKVVASEERHTSCKGPIHSELSFSFSDYDDPSNTHFGCLLALNDNIVAPGEGIKAHPHHDLEIVTYVVSGTLRHGDDRGNTQDLETGSLQVMSAGTGISHSESNPSEHHPVRFIQMWFLPSQRDLLPAWDSRSYSQEERMGELKPLVSGKVNDNSLRLNQDINIYVPILESGKELNIAGCGKRRTHLFLLSGHVDLHAETQKFSLNPGDTARIKNTDDLIIRSTGSGESAEIIIIDLP